MKIGDIFNIRIEKMAFGGKGLGYLVFEEGEKFVVFVDGAIEEQQVEIKITKKKKSFAEGKVVRVLEKAAYQVVDPQYQQISGAPWFEVPIEKQMQWKAEQVQELFQKFSGTKVVLDEVVGSPTTWNYRNKMEYSFGPTSETQEGDAWVHSGFGLGFKKRGQYWLVEALEKPSGLFDEAFEGIVPDIQKWCESTGLGVYNQRTHAGFWRNLLVRKSFSEDKLLICLIVNKKSGLAKEAYKKLQSDFLSLIQASLGDRVKGVFWQTSDSVSDSLKNYNQRDLLFGQPVLIERINALAFEISLDSFFQTNPQSAEKLYQKVSDCVGSESDVVLDLFCGTGTIGQIIKHQSPDTKVIGVELVEQAVEDAKANASRNNLEGLEFFVGDVGKFLKANPEHEGHIDTVIMDPPRAGIAPKTLQKVIDLGAKNLVYVSCNPATMARDTVTLQESGYGLEKLSMVDQFPHTAHTECVGKFIAN